MIKIDKTELFRNFVTLEAVLVGIPMVMFWTVLGILTLFADFNLTTINLGCSVILFSIYFMPPSLIASRLFEGPLIGVFPKGLAGWLVTIFMYSYVVVLLALISSLYTPLNRRKKSSVKDASARDHREQLSGR